MSSFSKWPALLAFLAAACVPVRTPNPAATLSSSLTLSPAPILPTAIHTLTPAVAPAVVVPTVSAPATEGTLRDDDAGAFIVFGAHLDPSSLGLQDERSGGVPWLVAAELGGERLIPIIQTCVFQVSGSSLGRVAVIVGSPGTNGRCSDVLAYPEQLMVVSLPDFQSQPVTPLLSAFDVLPDDFSSATRDGLEDAANAILAVSFAKPAWSPDGRYLAFVAATDGPSSDLYLYDSELGDITRVSAGSNQADAPTWSPNGEGYLHQEVEYVQEPMNLAPYPRALWWFPIRNGAATRYADPAAAQPDWLVFDGWIDGWRFVFHYVPAFGSAAEGGLLIGDARIGKPEKVLGAVEDLAILAGEERAFLLASVNLDSSGSVSPTRTLYLIDAQAMTVARLPLEVHGDPQLVAHNRYDQFLIAVTDGVIRLKGDGIWTEILATQNLVDFSLSPDGLYAVVGQRAQPELLAAFGPNGTIDSTTAIDGELSSSSVWRPDGSVYFHPETGRYIRPPDPNVTFLTNPLSRLAWSAWFRNPGGLLRPGS